MNIVCTYGHAEVITLRFVATDIVQKSYLSCGFDTLGDDFKMKVVAERDDGPRQGPVAFVAPIR